MKLPSLYSFILGGICVLVVALVALAIILIGGCAQRITVDHERYFMAPDTWDIKGGGITVGLYQGDCCCVAGRIADTVAARANRDEITWSKMADRRYADSVLAATCREFGNHWSRPPAGVTP